MTSTTLQLDQIRNYTKINEIRYKLPSPISFKKGTKVSLASFYGFKSLPSFLSSFNNVTFQYIYDGNTRDVVIPNNTGVVTVSQFNEYLHYVMKQNGDYEVIDGVDTYFLNIVDNLFYNKFTFTSTVTSGGTCPSLIVPNNNITQFFGLDAGTYPQTNLTTQSWNSTTIPQSSFIRNWNVNLNIVNNMLDINHPNLLYSFIPEAKQWDSFREKPPFPIMCDVFNNTSFSEIVVRLTDENNTDLPILDYVYGLKIIIQFPDNEK